MTIREAIFKHLSTHGDLAPLVGTRIYPMHLPQKPTYPAIVIALVESNREHDQAGFAGLTTDRFEITAAANTPADAARVAAMVRLVFDGYQGTMGGEGGVEVDAVFHDGARELYDDELQVYGVSQDFRVMHAG